MERLVVDGFGKFVGRQGRLIVVRESGKTLYKVLVEELRQVIVTGSGAISTEALTLLSQYGVEMIIIDHHGDVVARLSGPEMRTVLTRKEQYYAYRDHRSGHLARRMTFAKCRNQMSLLGTFAKTRKETEPGPAQKMMEMREAISNSLKILEQLPDKPVEEIRPRILAAEGLASSAYWLAMMSIAPAEFAFKERSGRGAGDPVNALLNYGYGILEGEVWRAVHFSGLDPYGGYLHADRPGKPSMVLDLMEEFRQQIVDRNVFALIGRHVVKSTDFEVAEGFSVLSDSARKALLKEILGKLNEYVSVGSEHMRWADLILTKARDAAKYLRGEAGEYEGFYLRW